MSILITHVSQSQPHSFKSISIHTIIWINILSELLSYAARALKNHSFHIDDWFDMQNKIRSFHHNNSWIFILLTVNNNQQAKEKNRNEQKRTPLISIRLKLHSKIVFQFIYPYN